MKLLLLFSLSFLLCQNLSATETNIIVRAKAKDAKFIGSSLGGAYIIIRNTINQQVLAEGKTSGSTGNTKLIMSPLKDRRSLITDDNTAGFKASIDIDEPVFVTIEVNSPLNYKNAKVLASVQLWLIPGKHILGDGIIVEIPGFIIDILTPRTHQYISLNSVKNELFPIRTNIVMMCGCIISKGGTWDADEIEIKAVIKRNNKFVFEKPLKFVDVNLFEGTFKIEKEGKYEIIVYAYNPQTGNTGVDKINFVIYD